MPRDAPRKRLRRAALILIGVIAVWVLGDLIYSRVVAHQIAQWEATIDRNADGVWRGCEAYSIGEGATALLFVHGINASPQHYARLAPRLADDGYACRVMRLPGFAEPIDRYAASTRDDWITAVDQELAALRQNHTRVGLVAHSLGGAVAIGQLISEPQSADFAVLLAPATAVSNARSPIVSTRAWHEFAERTLIFTTVLNSPFGIDSHDPANENYPGRTPFTPRSVVEELYTLMDANNRRAEQFQTPLLMVLTKDDIVIDYEAAVRFHDRVPTKYKQLLFLDDSGHAIPIDYGWKKVADAIDAFAKRDDLP